MKTNSISISAGERAVEIIPPIKNTGSDFRLSAKKTLRVAAYCRVSTDEESQQQSYHTQKLFYTDYIRSRPGWHMAGIYADEAKSGTNTKYRPEFNRMINDAKDGKIDYIITKSISRLARNTIDALTTIRLLQSLSPPVGIFFEKENLDTLDSKGELILTILSALAQEESRSISENIRWSIQKNFEKGHVRIDPDRMLGYERGTDGAWLINEAQANIVRYIFQQFSLGISGNAIARELNHMGLTTVKGNKWYPSAVFLILRNEKYIGDCEMQKYVTENFLTHKSVRNTGQARKFYITNHHPPIIDRRLWDKVQSMLQKTCSKSIKKEGVSSIYNSLICSDCGSVYSRTAYTARASNYSDDRQTADPQFKETYTFSYGVWRCKKKYQSSPKQRHGRLSHTEKTFLDQNCSSQILYECAVKQSFMEMLYRLKREYEACGESCPLCQTFASVLQSARSYEKNSSFASEQFIRLQSEIDELETQYHQVVSDRRHCASLEDPSAQSQISFYDTLIQDLKQLSEIKKAEYKQLEQDLPVSAQILKTFTLFLHSLQELSSRNKAGLPIKIACNDNGITALPKIAEAPDLLPFNQNLYHSFIKNGLVKGDTILYRTTFGVELESTGNLRTLSNFCGFRTCSDNGTMKLLTETWQVNGKSIQYQKTPLHKPKSSL